MTNKWVHIVKNAKCYGQPTEWFFPTPQKGPISVKPGSPLFNAFTICNECTIKTECLNYALQHNCVGVWGGKYISAEGVSNLKLKEQKQ